jgi:hypothetical protein
MHDANPHVTALEDRSAQDKGRKRHIAVDTLGLLISVLVTAASVQDRDGARPLLAQLVAVCARVRLAWADGGVRHEALHDRVEVKRTPPPGCRGSRANAEGSLTWETLGRAASSPDNAGTCWYCQTVRVRLAQTERRT